MFSLSSATPVDWFHGCIWCKKPLWIWMDLQKMNVQVELPPCRRFAYVFILDVAAYCNCWAMYYIKLSMYFACLVLIICFLRWTRSRRSRHSTQSVAWDYDKTAAQAMMGVVHGRAAGMPVKISSSDDGCGPWTGCWNASQDQCIAWEDRPCQKTASSAMPINHDYLLAVFWLGWSILIQLSIVIQNRKGLHLNRTDAMMLG
jgi:hypothetical protein